MPPDPCRRVGSRRRGKLLPWELIQAVGIEGRRGRPFDVSDSKGPLQLSRGATSEQVKARNADSAQVLRLKAQVSAAHLHGIAFDEHLGDAREKQTAENLRVPALACNPVEVVVRIEPARVKDGMYLRLYVGDQQLRLARERVVHPIDRAIPLLRSPAGDIAPMQRGGVCFEEIGRAHV